MEALTPFAQMPTTPEPIIAQVRRLLADDLPQGMTVEPAVLDSVADHAVRELWGSRVKTFVPVLALRTARETLHEQDLLVLAEQPMVATSEASTTLVPRGEHPRRDILALQDDVILHDDRDVLPL